MQTVHRTGAQCAAMVADLEGRLASNRARVAAIAQERRGHALSASLGDEGALQIVRELDAEEAQLTLSQRNFGAAIAQAQDLRDAAYAREREERRVAALHEAHELVAEILEDDAEIDAAFARAAVVLELRQGRVDRLVATGAMGAPADSFPMGNGTQLRSAMIGALLAAGVNRSMLPLPSGGAAQRLADHDRGYIRPPALPGEPQDAAA